MIDDLNDLKDSYSDALEDMENVQNGFLDATKAFSYDYSKSMEENLKAFMEYVTGVKDGYKELAQVEKQANASSGGTSSSFAYARLVSTINYTQGAELYTTTNNIFIEKAEDITSLVCKKKNGYGYTETITIRSEDRDNPSNYKTISVFFSPGSGANSTTPLNPAQINDLLFIG
jgi:hypothetical protein